MKRPLLHRATSRTAGCVHACVCVCVFVFVFVCVCVHVCSEYSFVYIIVIVLGLILLSESCMSAGKSFNYSLAACCTNKKASMSTLQPRFLFRNLFFPPNPD